MKRTRRERQTDGRYTKGSMSYYASEEFEQLVRKLEEAAKQAEQDQQ